jgi:hypothetical protein
MSADNGIYIGQFTDQFRIIHTTNIENIGINDKLIYEYFKTGQVFHYLDQALLDAANLAEGIEILEYGINIIKFPHPWSYYAGLSDDHD